MSQAQAVGPILRILGLAIELLGVTILMLSGRNDAVDVGSRFGITTNQIWGTVIVGFALWATGTALIFARKGRTQRKDAADLDRDAS
ncbi:hypothetical protein [Paludisphaera borealis]|uniref:DUF378 domain-containing protein n=1 Tax=Paludisphaera borealis TaxID=1387353 RepID=A0A1U7CPF2_9BACT|nr:hypothetical protein [Paludisphaera borealis]APW60788.1 hypothetical protein BSF38_02277 [Paludisphaera borealis]